MQSLNACEGTIYKANVSEQQVTRNLSLFMTIL